jgi:hypothetical protein
VLNYLHSHPGLVILTRLTVKHGVPQVDFTTLFIRYINDLPARVNILSEEFADDTCHNSI